MRSQKGHMLIDVRLSPRLRNMKRNRNKLEM
ncbi:hypothetical protein ACFX11_035487 [Malus domestica]